MSKGKSLLVLGTLVAASLVFTAVAAQSTLADKPDANGNHHHAEQNGGGKGKKSGDTSTGTVTVAPDPVPLGSQSVDISGTGFGANEYLVVTLPGACCDMGATTDGNGDFTVTFYRNFDWPSEYIVEVQRGGVTVASTTFTVQ